MLVNTNQRPPESPGSELPLRSPSWVQIWIQIWEWRWDVIAPITDVLNCLSARKKKKKGESLQTITCKTCKSSPLKINASPVKKLNLGPMVNWKKTTLIMSHTLMKLLFKSGFCVGVFHIPANYLATPPPH